MLCYQTSFLLDVIYVIGLIAAPIVGGIAWYFRDKLRERWQKKHAKRCPSCGVPFKAPPTARTICPECGERYAKHA